MEKEFEALDWLNDTLGYFLNKTTDTHCQITLTRNQATEFVEEHKKIEQALQRLAAIEKGKNTDIISNYMAFQNIEVVKPSEALEKFDYIGNDIKFAYDDDYVSYDYTDDVEYIKQTLLKAQEQEKENAEYKEALRIIFEKEVDIEYIKKETTTFEDYNKWVEFVDSMGVNITKNRNRQLTQEEFNLVKRWSEK